MRVLVTGGTRGIGRACVEYFARQGDRVAFLYHNRADLAEQISRNTGAMGIRADIEKAEDAKRATDAALLALGGIDVLINNAGISQIKLFTELTDEDWSHMLNTNLSGAFYVTREALKPMISQKSGRVIFIGSMWGKVGASCEVHYSAAKSGLRGMTMALAKELGLSGITVNCIEPGVILTDMNRELSEDTLRELKEETPVGRLGTPEDVASLAVFLASKEAGFITGQVIGVDGGFAI
ncbi:MAG: 3-oxoacyl-ACP reductase FabG [Clostridia bacterium]|nr:3-oxoacyl-ACP reductase FabG [Clostridia bacterium]